MRLRRRVQGRSVGAAGERAPASDVFLHVCAHLPEGGSLLWVHGEAYPILHIAGAVKCHMPSKQRGPIATWFASDEFAAGRSAAADSTGLPLLRLVKSEAGFTCRFHASHH